MNLKSSSEIWAFMLDTIGRQENVSVQLITSARKARMEESREKGSGSGRKKTYILPSSLALYLANSSSHSAGPRGGSMPLTGFHSVMLNPDSVRRVRPPTTTMLKVRKEVK
jgi:hypothetical protein